MKALKPEFNRLRGMAGLVGGLLIAITVQGEIRLPVPPEHRPPPGIAPPPPPREPGSPVPLPATNTTPRMPLETEQPLRLTLDLHDGSRIIGVPTVTHFSLRAVFGTVGVDLNRLESLQFTTNKELASAVFQNGDKVTGALNVEAIEVKTCFGLAKIPLIEIRRLGVLPGGKARNGLVLH